MASSSDAGRTPDWVALQSTFGTSRTIIPNIPVDVDLGFILPAAPASSSDAIRIVRQLLADGGLPSSDDYNAKFGGMRQSRLSHAVLRLVLQCLDAWAGDSANYRDSTYVYQGRTIRAHQLSPLVVCYLNSARRENSFGSWEASLIPEMAYGDDVRDAMANERPAAGTIQECTMGHRSNSANLYLVSTQNHPSFGLSFNARALKRLDPERYQELLANEEERKAHEGRGGEDHDSAVYITAGSRQVYIYDPAFELADWTDSQKARRLGNANMIGRARELLDHLRKGPRARDRSLKEADVFLGGGGNEASDCRPMALSWAIDIISRKWMRSDGAVAAGRPPLCFEDEEQYVKLKW